MNQEGPAASMMRSYREAVGAAAATQWRPGPSPASAHDLRARAGLPPARTVGDIMGPPFTSAKEPLDRQAAARSLSFVGGASTRMNFLRGFGTTASPTRSLAAPPAEDPATFDLPPWYKRLDYDADYICSCHDANAQFDANVLCGGGGDDGTATWTWSLTSSGNCIANIECSDGTSGSSPQFPCTSLCDGLPRGASGCEPKGSCEDCQNELDPDGFSRDLSHFVDDVEGTWVDWWLDGHITFNPECSVPSTEYSPGPMDDEYGAVSHECADSLVQSMMATAMALMDRNWDVIKWAMCMIYGDKDIDCMKTIFNPDASSSSAITFTFDSSIVNRGMAFSRPRIFGNEIVIWTTSSLWQDFVKAWGANQPPADGDTEQAQRNRLAIAAKLGALLTHECAHQCFRTPFDFIRYWRDNAQDRVNEADNGYGGGGGFWDLMANVWEFLSPHCTKSYNLEHTVLWLLYKRYSSIKKSTCFDRYERLWSRPNQLYMWNEVYNWSFDFGEGRCLP